MPDPAASVVICNTSPLYYLHRIGRLDLLRSLHGVYEDIKALAGE